MLKIYLNYNSLQVQGQQAKRMLMWTKMCPKDVVAAAPASDAPPKACPGEGESIESLQSS